jgi:hypothetical protein
MVPRSFGFIVNNFICGGDWPSITMNGLGFDPGVREMMLQLHRKEANVYMLRQLDGFDGFNRGHFFKSRTYQTALEGLVKPLYNDYGM